MLWASYILPLGLWAQTFELLPAAPLNLLPGHIHGIPEAQRFLIWLGIFYSDFCKEVGALPARGVLPARPQTAKQLIYRKDEIWLGSWDPKLLHCFLRSICRGYLYKKSARNCSRRGENFLSDVHIPPSVTETVWEAAWRHNKRIKGVVTAGIRNHYYNLLFFLNIHQLPGNS